MENNKKRILSQTQTDEQRQREYERDLRIAVENDCINSMKRTFEKEGYRNACINLQLAETRQYILDNVPESNFERNWLDKNYEKIFNKVKKIYENDMKAKEQLQQIIIEKQAEEARIQEEKNRNSLAYKIIFGILFVFIALFMLFKFAAIAAIVFFVIVFLVALGLSK